jgi:DNA-binding NarL/FixJ family response regulator
MTKLDSRESAARTRRVLTVDDQVAVREMLALVLEGMGGFVVVAEAATGLEGLKLFRRHKPDLIVAGLALREMSGPEMFGAMREEAPSVRRMVFSGTRNRALLLAGLRCNPHGFVHKTESLDVLREALGAVAEGKIFFGAFATALADEAVGRSGLTPDLPPQQRVVLQLVAEGHSTKQIASRMALSPKTVDNYRSRLMEKLGLRDVASLTMYAVREGLVE